MEAETMRLVHKTSSLLHGKKDAFTIPEMSEPKACGHEVPSTPTSPGQEVVYGDAKPLLSDVVL